MKTFFVDIDGVVYKNGKINRDVIDAINHSNNRLVFCTGRGYVRCLEIIGDYLNKDSILILENGSKIVDYRGNIIYSKNIVFNTKELMKNININELEYVIFNPNNLNYYISFSKIPLKHVKINYKVYLDFYNELLHQNLTQIVIKFTNDKYRDSFINYLHSNGINIKKSEDYIIINEHNVNKGTGITNYIKKFKMGNNNIIVIGNDYNDIEMFDIDCKHKIVVKDEYTPDILLKKATDITDFDNLYRVVNKIINNDSDL